MRLIDLNSQGVLNTLHGHVLPDGPQLVVDVPVSGLLLSPLGHHQLQRLLENWLGTHVRRVWRRNESVVGLLESLAIAFDNKLTPVSDDFRASFGNFG